MSRDPGLYYDVPELEYHADEGSVSSTELRKILDSPAKLRHYLDSPREYKKAWDVGHAVHAGVLGVGLEIVEIPSEVLASNGATSTKAAREFIADAQLDGKVPLKAAEVAEINAMVASVKTHPIAGPLFSSGKPEVSAWATDPDTGLLMRARFDWEKRGKRPILADLKTVRSADAQSFMKDVWNFGYHIQQEAYRHTYKLITGEEPAFVFVLVEKEAPYLVRVVELSENTYGDDFPTIGREKLHLALATYKQCLETNTWPGYPNEITKITPAGWMANQHNQDMEGAA